MLRQGGVAWVWLCVAAMNLLFEGQEIVQDVDGGGAAGRDVLQRLVSLDVDRVGALPQVDLEHLDATDGRIERGSQLVAGSERERARVQGGENDRVKERVRVGGCACGCGCECGYTTYVW